MTAIKYQMQDLCCSLCITVWKHHCLAPDVAISQYNQLRLAPSIP